MRKIRIPLLLALLIGATAACGLVESLTETSQGVSMITRTPSLDEANGMDPDLVTALTTGGVFNQLNDGATAVFVGLGQRPELTSLSDWETINVTPVTGATVEVRWNSNTVAVCEQDSAEGGYAASSVEADPCGDTNLAYVVGATYFTEADIDGTDSTLEVVAPDAINAADVSFSPALAAADDFYGANLQSHPRNTALTVDWSADANAADRMAVVTVFRVEFTGSGATDALVAANWTVGNNPVHANQPDSAMELIDIIVLKNFPTSEEIPSSVFDRRGLYFVVLVSMELSETKDGFSLGSAALAGVGTPFVFWVD